MPENSKIRESSIPCNSCNRTTRHEIIYEKVEHFASPDGEIRGQIVWQILSCRGCDEVSAFRSYGDSEMIYPDGEYYEDKSYLPTRDFDHIKPKAFQDMPYEAERIYGELIQAFNNDSRILCSIGLRMLLEATCKDKALEAGTSESRIKTMNLQSLIDEGLKDAIPKNILSHLHGFRFLGNEAAHGLSAPSKRVLAEAIEVIEDIMNLLYNLDYRTSRLYSRYSRDRDA